MMTMTAGADGGLPLPRVLLYLWALPNTLLGLAFVPLALMTGGRARLVRGCVEVHGGLVTWFLRRGLPVLGPAAAMTLGHVILGRDRDCLDASRDHEHAHVRQYERWGPAAPGSASPGPRRPPGFSPAFPPIWKNFHFSI